MRRLANRESKNESKTEKQHQVHQDKAPLTDVQIVNQSK
jgi:hypothetical protein